MSNNTSTNETNSTLTLLASGDRTKKLSLNQNEPPLTDEETKEAVNEQNVDTFVKKFRKVERRFVDPAVDNQKIGLISFIPAKGASPNDNGVYGFAKLRGNYPNDQESSERAEYLIRNVDSYHQIYHAYVGRPFPITESSDYSKKVSQVDLKRETSASISADVKKKREKEAKEIEEVKQREKELLADVAKEEEDPDDRYTTLRVKKAQLTWTFYETEKKMKQMAVSIAKARKEIEDWEGKMPELRERYYERYMEARKKAGLSTDKASVDTSFIKYMVEDINIPEAEKVYQDLYGKLEDINELDESQD